MKGVLVVLEYRGAWNRMSWEALAAGRGIAVQLHQPLFVAVAGAQLDTAVADLSALPLARAYAVRHSLLHEYTADGFIPAFEQLIHSLDPLLVFFPHTYQVRDFAPGLAARFDQTLIADVVAITTDSGHPVFVRQLLQGKLNADYVHTGAGVCFASLQAGAFRAASLIVSVGRGIKEQDNIPIVRELADALGAELAASRPMCDNGWLPMERQVGSSGQSVSPKVYIAVGISGAIQHLVGMKASKSIIAINKDENAPIFEVADYGIVGDLFEVVPALTAAVRKVKSA